MLFGIQNTSKHVTSDLIFLRFMNVVNSYIGLADFLFRKKS